MTYYLLAWNVTAYCVELIIVNAYKTGVKLVEVKKLFQAFYKIVQLNLAATTVDSKKLNPTVFVVILLLTYQQTF